MKNRFHELDQIFVQYAVAAKSIKTLPPSDHRATLLHEIDLIHRELLRAEANSWLEDKRVDKQIDDVRQSIANILTRINNVN